MSAPIRVSSVELVRAGAALQREGMLGWIMCTINDTFVFDGITLRRTHNGHLTLSYPAPRDRAGKHHSVIHVIDEGARQEIERQILQQLGLAQEVAP